LTFDLAIIGAGFGGSLMAMVARRLGLSVVLLEQGRHPRVVIGESTTPLSNLLLEKLCATYDLPRIAPLAKWGSWQRTYPELACGLKRGFTFYHGREELLVAASPRDEIADTHWYRADVDHFLVREAQTLGVDYRDGVRIETVKVTVDGVKLRGAGLEIDARLLIDATGPRGFLHRALQLEEASFPWLPATEGLYSHFTGVDRSSRETFPYPADDAAVHHVFDGGWVWVLRFNNGITSAGVAATRAVANELRFDEGEPAWRRLLERLPALASQFERAEACQAFRHMPTMSFRSRTMAGERWAMLPSAAGFVDPLLSTGFALTLLGIERLAKILEHPRELPNYAEQTDHDLLAASRLIGLLYAKMGHFSDFIAVTMLYFAAVSFAETAQRLGKPQLAPGFLLREHPVFGPAMERGTDVSQIPALIEPFNVGGFADPARNNRYAVRAEDLLAAAKKLKASQAEITAMLEKSGFFAH
jgi:tetracycline 7-halogenase / FADH2 O2-dependent halogenase